ncbi:MAG: type II toxin-antitoxin system VapC family toxin [Bacillota bacterium]
MFGDRGKLLIDTDIIIDHLRGQAMSTSLLKRIIIGDEFIGFYSAITEIELFSAETIKDKQVEDIMMLLGSMVRADVDSEVAQCAGRLLGKYRKSNGLEMADAVIAATAIVHGIPVVSRNVKHYSFISGLILTSPDILSP